MCAVADCRVEGVIRHAPRRPRLAQPGQAQCRVDGILIHRTAGIAHGIHGVVDLRRAELAPVAERLGPYAPAQAILAPEIGHAAALCRIEKMRMRERQAVVNQAEHPVGCHRGRRLASAKSTARCEDGHGFVVDRITHRQAQLDTPNQTMQAPARAQLPEELAPHACAAEAHRSRHRRTGRERPAMVDARYAQPGGSARHRQQVRHTTAFFQLQRHGQPKVLDGATLVHTAPVALEACRFGPGQVGVGPVDGAVPCPVDAGERAPGQRRPVHAHSSSVLLQTRCSMGEKAMAVALAVWR